MRDYVDNSWNARVNPDNKPWVPGFRFCVRQTSLTRCRGSTFKNHRRYWVHFEIGMNGTLYWTGGVKARPETTEEVQDMYARGRPGSNYA